MRRLRLILCIGAIVGFCGTASAETGERSRPWLREPLRIALERLLTWNLGADVTIGALEGPLVPEIVLRGVTIDVNGNRFADIDSFRARVDAWALFRDNAPLIELIEMQNAVFTLVRSARGEWNLPRSGDSASRDDGDDASLTELGIAEIHVSGLVLRIRDPGAELDIHLEINVEARAVTLPWEAPKNRATEAKIDINLRPSTLFGERIDSGTLHFSLAAGQLRNIDIAASGGFGALRVQGELDVSRSWLRPAGRLALTGTTLRAGDLVIGDLDAKLTGASDGLVRIESFVIDGEVPIRIESGSEIRLGDGLTFERFAFTIAGQPVKISGGIGADTLRALHVSTAGFRAELLGNLLDSPVALGGLVNAEVTFDGTLPFPSLSGRAEWSHPRVSEVEIERAFATVETVDDTLVVHVQAVESSLQILNSTATIPYAAGIDPAEILHSKATTLELHGDGIELALFEPFIARQLRELGGRAQIELSLQGARPQPHIEGSVVLTGGSVRIPLLHSTFAPIDGRMVFDGSAVTLHDLRIGASGGEAIAVGRVELDQLIPASADLKLTLHHFPLARSSFLRSYVDGEIAVVGPINGLAVSGDLALQDTRVRLPEADDPLLREIHVVARSSSDGATTSIVEGGDEPGPYEHATFDLRLQIPRGTWVKGRGANLDLTGELALHKRALEAPRYAGEVEVVRGTYTLHGRRFAIRRGTVRFDGSTDLNPQIDIEAVHRVSDIEIIAYLTGRAFDPVLRLESEPVLPESEVLHYLVFGRSSEEATNSDLQIGAAAGALAAGVALSQVIPMLEEALPIDTLEILIPTDQSDGAIGIGKYVHEDVYIRYGRTLSRDPVDEVSIELRLDEHWSVESQASSDENAGADLIWSYDF